jgi:N-acetylglutamate synthase-like GNAT family acetyltransferase
MGDELEIYQLFYDTVHYVNRKDYTQEQVDTWAPKNPDMEKWRTTLKENDTFVAVNQEDSRIIGFADLEKNGYLNRGYVHKDFQRQGVGKSLLRAREEQARVLGLKILFSDVSITAKPFFEQQGYITEAKQSKNLGGVTFINYRMIKKIL